MQLSAQQKADYRRDGFLIFRELFSQAEVAILRREVDRVADLRVEEVRRENDEGLPKAMFAMHEVEGRSGSAAMHALVRLPRTLGVARQVLEDQDLYLHHTKVNLKTGIDGTVWPWHQDYGSWHLDGIARPELTTFMVMLDGATEIGGCLYFLPGSHVEGRYEAYFDTSTAYHLWAVPTDVMRDRVARYGPPVPLAGKPGDAVIFDCNLLHASGHNLSAKNRWQAYLCYNRCANRPEDVAEPRATWVRNTDWAPLQITEDRAILGLGENAA